MNVCISAGIAALEKPFGVSEVNSALMTRLLHGPAPLLVLAVTNGAVLTEIAFRGYVIERLGALCGGRRWSAAIFQIAVTTLMFTASRGVAHGIVWLCDDLVFTAFYLSRRDLTACLIAHAVPNAVAASLIGLGVAK